MIAASAGNHALGLAYHARLLDVPATVVMPRFAPITKIVNCRLSCHGPAAWHNIAEARGRADELAAENGFTYINGYDDDAIIAGQGTLGLEIVAQVSDLDAILVPVGGGGSVAGVGLGYQDHEASGPGDWR